MRSRRGFLGRLLGLTAGTVAAVWAVPRWAARAGAWGWTTGIAAPIAQLKRRTRPLRRADLYEDHDLAG